MACLAGPSLPGVSCSDGSPCLVFDLASAVRVLGERLAASPQSHPFHVQYLEHHLVPCTENILFDFHCINQLSYTPTVKVLFNKTKYDTIVACTESPKITE